MRILEVIISLINELLKQATSSANLDNTYSSLSFTSLPVLCSLSAFAAQTVGMTYACKSISLTWLLKHMSRY